LRNEGFQGWKVAGTSDVMDLQDFCARVLREYEDVIATIIQRPWPPMSVRPHVDETGGPTAGEGRPMVVDNGAPNLSLAPRIAA
jgi:hypothetical protein